MMTAAMAFFSIALTLNLTGVRLTQIRLSDLRPTAVRSFMERQLNMASVPIIRYYDHLRLVYEVQSRMRELRGDAEETPQQGDQGNQSQPSGSGESKKKEGGSRMQMPHQDGQPARANVADFGDLLETSFTCENDGTRAHPVMNTREQGNSEMMKIRAFRQLRNPRRAYERSKVWTA